MSALARLGKFVTGIFGLTLRNPDDSFVRWLRGGDDYDGGSDSGVEVNRKTIMQHPPFWYGVNKIAGHVGQLPLFEYVRDAKDERRKAKATKEWGYFLMAKQPNEFMDPITFRKTLQAHAICEGNGRAAIVRNSRAQPIELIPLLPENTKSMVVNGAKVHVWTDPKSLEVTILDDIDVLHIAGLGYDGIQGYSLVEFAKNSIGLGLAAEKHSNSHFRNNAIPSFVLTAPSGVFKKPEEAQKFLDDWNKYHKGVTQSNRAALLREGIEAKPLGATGQDSQWIQQRQFQRVDAALWTMLEQILGDDSSVSYNSLEQKNLAYLTNCLMYWLTIWEQQCNMKLLTYQQFHQDTHYFKFLVAALLRGTIKERYEVYQIGRQIEVLSANDVRELEDMPPIEGGDEYKNPSINPKDAKAADKQPAEETMQKLAILKEELRAEFSQRIEANKPTVNLTVQPSPVEVKNEIKVDVQPTPVEMKNEIALPEQSPPAVNIINEIHGPSEAVSHHAIRSNIQQTIETERRRLVKAAEGKRFIAWVDDFYSETGIVPWLRTTWVACGGTAEQAEAYAAESKALVMQAAGESQQHELAAAVEKLTASWSERAELQAGLILGRAA